MSLSRRSFVKTLGMGTAGAVGSAWISGRGREAWVWGAEVMDAGSDDIILSSNENPLGPGKAALEAIERAIGPTGAGPGRYPGSFYRNPLREVIAAKFKVKPENILLGCGSTQILTTVTHLYTSKEKPLVGALPTYEECFGYAAQIGSRVKTIPLNSRYKMDLDTTLTVVKGAGLLYYCSPNNPVATLIAPGDAKEFLPRALKRSPDTRILIDEAYIDYVTEPGHRSFIPLAVEDPRVIVARTFSKAYGMAGLRVGYAIAHEDTIKEMGRWQMGNAMSGLSMAGAIGAIEEDETVIAAERERNRKVREFTRSFFKKAGYESTESQTNFVFVDVRMPTEEFQAECRKRGVRVGRAFPPLWTHSRISLGTMEEMTRATRVFAEVLRAKAAAA
jgi:histidinol-phosphate aminotransferase